MKTKNIFKIAALFLFLGAFTACVQDDDYSIPTISATEPDVTETNTFKQIKDMYAGDVVTFSDGLVISGYVVSSDESGNFYKSIAIQNDVDGIDDDASNPRLGLKLLIDASDLFERFNVGRKVYIRLDGLAMNESRDGSGDYEIGLYDESEFNSLTEIPEYILNGYSFGDVTYPPAVERSLVTEVITPKILNISDFTFEDVNTLVQLTEMQTVNITDTYAGLPSDQYDAERRLKNCATNATTVLATSTFASFKDQGIPTGKGTIKAILTRNFDGNAFMLKLNSASDVDFTDMNRCDPILLDCGLATSAGTTNLFSDDFETQSTNSLISGNGWTNFIESGTEGWEAYSSGGANSSLGISARVGSYNSNDSSTVSWLITPAIDFDAQNGETLQFKTSNSFSDGSEMELVYSTDWDGTTANISTATWGLLPAGYITQDSDNFGTWYDSGIVDLSCATGTMYIGFKYTGSGSSDFDGTYELDEISIDYTP